MRSIRTLKSRRPSPAMLVALVALFVGLGGTSYAAVTVTSANIKNNDVRGVDLKNGTVEARDVKGNSLTGGRINESTLGQVPSAANATQAGEAQFSDSTGSFGGLAHTAYARNVEVVTESSPSNSEDKGMTVDCPGTKVVIGGGVETIGNDPNLAVQDNDQNGASGWLGRVVEGDDVAADWSIQVTAVCADI